MYGVPVSTYIMNRNTNINTYQIGHGDEVEIEGSKAEEEREGRREVGRVNTLRQLLGNLGGYYHLGN